MKINYTTYEPLNYLFTFEWKILLCEPDEFVTKTETRGSKMG